MYTYLINYIVLAVNAESTWKRIEPGLKDSIQLGMQQIIEDSYYKPERNMIMQGFNTAKSLYSKFNSNHHYPAFRFTSHAPIIYQDFRHLNGIQPNDYLKAFCNSPLHEMSNPGASRALFYLTSDGKFIIKTVKREEFIFLKNFLTGYYIYLKNNPSTMLTKFFGHYSYQSSLTHIQLVTMNNIIPSNIQMHKIYDLKGSTYLRNASEREKKKASPILKDVDFRKDYPNGIFLKPKCLENLLETILIDCIFLRSHNIMDYSILMGIHNVDFDQKEKKQDPVEILNIPTDTGTSSDEKCTSPTGGILAQSESGDRLLLFVGIIDILQDYNSRKKLESLLKSKIQNEKTISVQDPDFYANRFWEFMTKYVKCFICLFIIINIFNFRNVFQLLKSTES